MRNELQHCKQQGLLGLKMLNAAQQGRERNPFLSSGFSQLKINTGSKTSGNSAM